MTDDPKARDEAAAWLARLRAPDGERDRAAFERWRNADPGRAAAFARVEAQWRGSSRIAASPIARTSRLRPSLWTRWDLRLGAVGLGGAAATLAFVALNPGQGPAPATPPQVASALGQIRTVVLPDGSRVTLDTNSAVSLRFTDRERRVRLDRGRARFAVAADPHRRFVVAAGDLLVFDRGTVFDVRAVDGTVNVALIEGAVEVRDPARRALPRPLALAPGQEVTILADAPRASAPRRSGAGAATWPTGMLSVDGVPLAQVIAEANRYNATKLALGDPALGTVRVTGAFRATAPGELAASLRASFGLRVETRGDRRIELWPASNGVSRREGG
jgi:transmembrane sensor